MVNISIKCLFLAKSLSFHLHKKEKAQFLFGQPNEIEIRSLADLEIFSFHRSNFNVCISVRNIFPLIIEIRTSCTLSS